MNTFAVCLVILACIGTSVALECYFCTGSTTGCGDPFDKTKNLTTSKCTGYCTKYKLITGSSSVITRACIPACVQTDVSEGGTRAVNTCCQVDKCNGAGHVSVSKTVMAAATVITGAFLLH